jgi:hypothetical protein
VWYLSPHPPREPCACTWWISTYHRAACGVWNLPSCRPLRVPDKKTKVNTYLANRYLAMYDSYDSIIRITWFVLHFKLKYREEPMRLMLIFSTYRPGWLMGTPTTLTRHWVILYPVAGGSASGRGLARLLFTDEHQHKATLLKGVSVNYPRFRTQRLHVSCHSPPCAPKSIDRHFSTLDISATEAGFCRLAGADLDIKPNSGSRWYGSIYI